VVPYFTTTAPTKTIAQSNLFNIRSKLKKIRSKERMKVNDNDKEKLKQIEMENQMENLKIREMEKKRSREKGLENIKEMEKLREQIKEMEEEKSKKDKEMMKLKEKIKEMEKLKLNQDKTELKEKKNIEKEYTDTINFLKSSPFGDEVLIKKVEKKLEGDKKIIITDQKPKGLINKTSFLFNKHSKSPNLQATRSNSYTNLSSVELAHSPALSVNSNYSSSKKRAKSQAKAMAILNGPSPTTVPQPLVKSSSASKLNDISSSSSSAALINKLGLSPLKKDKETQNLKPVVFPEELQTSPHMVEKNEAFMVENNLNGINKEDYLQRTSSLSRRIGVNSNKWIGKFMKMKSIAIKK